MPDLPFLSPKRLPCSCFHFLLLASICSGLSFDVDGPATPFAADEDGIPGGGPLIAAGPLGGPWKPGGGGGDEAPDMTTCDCRAIRLSQRVDALMVMLSQ